MYKKRRLFCLNFILHPSSFLHLCLLCTNLKADNLRPQAWSSTLYVLMVVGSSVLATGSVR